jgi:hypothetical protein
MDGYTKILLFEIWKNLPKSKQLLSCDITKEKIESTPEINDRIDLYKRVLTEISPIIKKKDDRERLYRVLEGMLEVNFDSQTLNIMLSNLLNEKGKHLIGGVLNKLKYADIDTSSQPELMIKFTHHKDWQVRYAAIQLIALWADSKSRAEQRMQEILETSDKDFELMYAAQCLVYVGSPSSASALKTAITKSNKRDTLESCLYTINAIDGTNQLDYYDQMMNELKDNKVKSYIRDLLQKQN